MTTENTNSEETAALKALNETPLLCRSKTKAFILEAAKCRVDGYGKPRFRRVGQSMLTRIHARLRAVIADEIRQHPSKGKTLL